MFPLTGYVAHSLSRNRHPVSRRASLFESVLFLACRFQYFLKRLVKPLVSPRAALNWLLGVIFRYHQSPPPPQSPPTWHLPALKTTTTICGGPKLLPADLFLREQTTAASSDTASCYCGNGFPLPPRTPPPSAPRPAAVVPAPTPRPTTAVPAPLPPPSVTIDVDYDALVEQWNARTADDAKRRQSRRSRVLLSANLKNMEFDSASQIAKLDYLEQHLQFLGDVLAETTRYSSRGAPAAAVASATIGPPVQPTVAQRPSFLRDAAESEEDNNNKRVLLPTVGTLSRMTTTHDPLPPYAHDWLREETQTPSSMDED